MWDVIIFTLIVVWMGWAFGMLGFAYGTYRIEQRWSQAVSYTEFNCREVAMMTDVMLGSSSDPPPFIMTNRFGVWEDTGQYKVAFGAELAKLRVLNGDAWLVMDHKNLNDMLRCHGYEVVKKNWGPEDNE